MVAEHEGELVGTVAFYPDASQSGLENWGAGTASIRAVAVRPSARGGHIGRGLTEECISRARARGIAAVCLHTLPFMKAAIATYERLDFQRKPELDLEILGTPVIAYRLDL